MEPTQNRPILSQNYDSDSTNEKLEKASVSKVANEAINVPPAAESIKQKQSASIQAGSSKCYYVFAGVINNEIKVRGPVDPGSYSSNLLFGYLNKNKFCGEGTFSYPVGKDTVSYSGSIRDGKTHGQGKVSFPDGRQFEGQFEKGELHGYGKVIFKDGSVFEGKYENGKTVEGKLSYPDGASYEGGFLDDTYQGMGKLTKSNGDVCEGRFVTGKLQGKGILRYVNGALYEGEFVDSKPRGKGKLSFSNGAIDEGEFVGYDLHGEGKRIYSTGEVYEGGFINDKRHGRGKYTLTNGGTYEGDFVDDKFCGQGRRHYSDGSVYEGGFVNDRRHGFGALTASWGAHIGLWENGQFTYKVAHPKKPIESVEINPDHEIKPLAEKLELTCLTSTSPSGNKQCYLFKSLVDRAITVEGPLDPLQLPSGRSLLYGQMIDGKFSGEGTIFDNEHFFSYSGSIKEGMFHGKGRVVYQDKSIYEGDFIAGQRHGHGTYIYADGAIYEGEFVNNQLHGEGALSAEWGAEIGLWENDEFTFRLAPRKKL